VYLKLCDQLHRFNVHSRRSANIDDANIDNAPVFRSYERVGLVYLIVRCKSDVDEIYVCFELIRPDTPRIRTVLVFTISQDAADRLCESRIIRIIACPRLEINSYFARFVMLRIYVLGMTLACIQCFGFSLIKNSLAPGRASGLQKPCSMSYFGRPKLETVQPSHMDRKQAPSL